MSRMSTIIVALLFIAAASASPSFSSYSAGNCFSKYTVSRFHEDGHSPKTYLKFSCKSNNCDSDDMFMPQFNSALTRYKEYNGLQVTMASQPSSAMPLDAFTVAFSGRSMITSSCAIEEAPELVCGFQFDSVSCPSTGVAVGTATVNTGSGLSYSWSGSSIAIDNVNSIETAISWSPNCVSDAFQLTLTVSDSTGDSLSCSKNLPGAKDIDSANFVLVEEEEHSPFASAQVVYECGDEPISPTLGMAHSCLGSIFTEPTIEHLAISEADGSKTARKYVRTWSIKAPGQCGTLSHQETVIVKDRIAPFFLNEIDAEITNSCDNVAPPCTSHYVADACDAENHLDVSHSQIISQLGDDCVHRYDIIHTWVVTDLRNNTFSRTQVQHVVDNEAPELLGKPAEDNAVYECNFVPNLPNVTAIDNCDSNPSLSSFDSVLTQHDEECANAVYQVVWTTADECGNSDSTSWTYEVKDTQAPVILEIPEVRHVAAASDGQVPEPCQPVIFDECDDNVDVYETSTISDQTCPNNYTITYTWTAVDGCGLKSVESQTIHVSDSTPPILEAPADSEISVSCDAVPDYNVIATDAIDGAVDVEFVEEKVNHGGCDSKYTLERTWTACDLCGNCAFATQIVHVDDESSPEFDIPADMTLPCSTPYVLPDITGSDNCSPLTFSVNVTSVKDFHCPQSYTQTNTWTAQDDCGLITTKTNTVTFVDDQPPVLTNLPVDVLNAEVPYSVDWSAHSVGVTDNCDDLVAIDFTSSEASSGCKSVIVNTWTASDACGNSASHTQTVNVYDSFAPTFESDYTEDEYTISCGDTDNALYADSIEHLVTASDACGDDCITTSYVSSTEGSCPVTRVHTWTAEDSCGHSISRTIVVKIIDQVAPFWTSDDLPSDKTVADNWSEDNWMPTASDACGNAQVSYDKTVESTSCDTEYTIVRTWTATDGCGNELAYEQRITVTDETAPVWNLPLPENAFFSCSLPNSFWPADPTTGEASTVTFSSSPLAGLGCESNEGHVGTWTATDCAGNSITHSIDVIARDDSDPYFDYGNDFSDKHYQCSDDQTYAFSATDDCQDDIGLNTELKIHVTPIAEDQDGDIHDECTDGTHYRVWVVDHCGNEAEEEFQAFVHFDDVPTWTNQLPSGDELALTCDEPVPETFMSLSKCDASLSAHQSSTQLSSSRCETKTTVSWDYTDPCTGDISRSVVYTNTDSDSPTLDISAATNANKHFQCPAELPTVDDFSVSASDPCQGSIEVDRASTSSFVNNITTVTFTYTADDECVAPVAKSVSFFAQDTIAPDISGLVNHNLECKSKTNLWSTLSLDDNCDDSPTDMSYGNSSEVVYSNQCEEKIVYKFSVHDSSANLAEDEFFVIYSDTLAPEFHWEGETIVAEDACQGPLEPTCTTEYPECRSHGAKTVTCSADDGCNHAVSDSKDFAIVDVTDPIWTSDLPDSSVHVACFSAIPSAASMSAKDVYEPLHENDAGEVTVTVLFTSDIPTSAPDVCGQHIFTRTWSAADCAGNSITYTQTIHVGVDSVSHGLHWTGLPTVFPGENLDCSVFDAFVAPTLTSSHVGFTDDSLSECLTISLSPSSSKVVGDVLTVTYSAHSECANLDKKLIMTSVDSTQPEITEGSNQHLECGVDEIDTGMFPTATDDCDTDLESTQVTVSLVEHTVPECCAYTEKQTTTFVDDAGNQATSSQYITVVVDSTPPEFVDPKPSTKSYIEGQFDPYTWDDVADFHAIDTNTGMELRYDGTEDNPIFGLTRSVTCVEETPYLRKCTRTWIAKDPCQNYAQWVQVLTFVTHPDEYVKFPLDQTLYCNDTMPTLADYKALYADTDWYNNVNWEGVTFTDTVSGSTCAGPITVRSWYVPVLNGEDTTGETRYEYDDITAPILYFVNPSDNHLESQCSPKSVSPRAHNWCAHGASLGDISIVHSQAVAHGVVQTWSVSDACDNVGTITQTILVQDTQAPTILMSPIDPAALTGDSNLVVECDQVASVPSWNNVWWEAHDNCGNIKCNAIASASDPNCIFVDTYSEECGTYTRSIQFQDDSGNIAASVAYSQTITVADSHNPEMWNLDDSPLLPTDSTLECGASLPAILPFKVTDNCDANPDKTQSTSTPACVASGTCVDAVTYQYHATDDCGGETHKDQTIIITDTTAPSLTGNDVNELCHWEIADYLSLVSTSDICDQDVTTSYELSEVDKECKYVKSQSVTYTATDDYGNIEELTLNLNAHDGDKPTISAAQTQITLECGIDTYTPPQLTVADDCWSSSELLQRVVHEPPVDGNNGDVLYTITVADCSSSAQVVVTVSTEDTRDPTWTHSSLPGSESFECADSVPAMEDLTSADSCDGLATVLGTEASDMTCVNQGSIQREWSRTDAAGHTVTHTQSIAINDDQAPTLSVEFSQSSIQSYSTDALSIFLIEGCDFPANIKDLVTASASDNCAAPAAEVFFAEQVSIDSSTFPAGVPVWATGYDSAFKWVFQADDGCQTTQTIVYVIVTDSSSPVIDINDVNADCDEFPLYDSAQSASDYLSGLKEAIHAKQPYTASTACGPVEVTDTLEIASWTCTDTVIKRTISAVGYAPEEVAFINIGTASVSLSHHPDYTGTSVLDCSDDEPAVLAPVINSECHSYDASDLVFSKAASNQVGNNFDMTRTWTLTDACGDTHTYSQTYSVRDTTDPSITFDQVEDFVLECGEPNSYKADAHDDCDDNVETVELSSASSGNYCDGLVFVDIHSATDANGNSAKHTHSYSFLDSKAPALANLPTQSAIDATCKTIPPLPQVSASDECHAEAGTPAPIVEFVETDTNIDGNADSYTITRTWTATDHCDHKDSFTQIITVSDNEAPEFTCVYPGATEFSCEEDIPVWDPTDCIHDDCSQHTSWTHSDSEKYEVVCQGTYKFDRTWTISDSSGNKETMTVTFSVTDESAPYYTNPALANSSPSATFVESAECDDVPVPQLQWEDVCSTMTDTFTVATSPLDTSDVDRYTIDYVFQAEDECGNSASKNWKINVDDTHGPEISNWESVLDGLTTTMPIQDAPANTQDFDIADQLIIQDNCDDGPEITSTVTISEICPYSYMMTIEYKATDRTGNPSDTYTVEFQVFDTEEPEFHNLPAPSTTLENIENYPSHDNSVTASDNSGESIIVTFVDEVFNEVSDSHYSISRTFTASDSCGNIATHTVVILVIDTEEPILCVTPTNIEAECDAVPVPCAICVVEKDINSNLQITESFSNSGVVKTINRTWTAIDKSNNIVTHSQIVTVVDSVAPQFTFVPEPEVTLECGCSVEPIPHPIAIVDNCFDVTHDIAPSTSSIAYTGTDKTVLSQKKTTWTASDGYNTNEISQLVTVKDTRAPVSTISNFFNGIKAISAAESFHREGQCHSARSDVEAAVNSEQEGSYLQLFGLVQPEDVHVSDECSQESSFSVSTRIESDANSCANNYDIIRTFSVADGIHSYDFESRLSVSDTIAPEAIEPTGNVCIHHDGSQDKFWAVLDRSELLEGIDQCGSDVDVSITACEIWDVNNSTLSGASFSESCSFFHTQDTFRFGVDAAVDRFVIKATLTDACHNEAHVTKSIAVTSSHNDANCDHTASASLVMPTFSTANI